MMSDKKHSLLRCAVKLFAKQGVNDTSTGSIAKAAGVAAGTLFNYFPTKKALVHEVYIEAKMAWIQAMRDGIKPSASTEDVFRGVWQASVGWAIQNPNDYDFCRQFHNLPGVGDAQLQKKLDKEMSFFYEAIEDAKAQGVIVDVAPELRDHFFEAWLDASIAYVKKVPKKDRSAAVEASFGMLWRAIKAS